jgi:hypothetical protein
MCARELLSRALVEDLQGKPTLGNPTTVQEFLRLKIGGLAYECFWVLFIDSQNRLIRAEEMFRGTLTQTSVYPREIIKRALQLNAAAVILSHNHLWGERAFESRREPDQHSESWSLFGGHSRARSHHRGRCTDLIHGSDGVDVSRSSLLSAGAKFLF